MSPDGSPQEQESWNKRFEMSLAEIYMELPDGHRAKKDYEALIAEPRGKMVEMSMRLDELEEEVRELKLKAPSLIQPPPPQPQSLIEAVDVFSAIFDKTNYKELGAIWIEFCHKLCDVKEAAKREKKRQELVEKVIAQTWCFVNFGGAHCGLAGVKIAITNLDTFDKGGDK